MIPIARARPVLAVTFAAFLAAQQPPPPVTLKATARLVQVSVVVHDRKGPVADLKKEDFQIKVDGQVQRISVFSVESAGTLPPPPPHLPPNHLPNPPPT